MVLATGSQWSPFRDGHITPICAYRLGGVHRYVMFSREKPSPACVVAVRMRDHNSLYPLRGESDGRKTRGNLAIAQSGVNQHTAVVMFEKRRIARTAATEDRQFGTSQAPTRIPKPSYH